MTKSKEKYKARFNEQMKWIKDVCDKFDAKHDMWQKAFERISDKSMTEDEVQWLQADHQKMLDLLKNIVLQQANQSAAASGSGGKKRKSGSRSSDILLEGPTTANGSKVSSNASRTVINEVQSGKKEEKRGRER